MLYQGRPNARKNCCLDIVIICSSIRARRQSEVSLRRSNGRSGEEGELSHRTSKVLTACLCLCHCHSTPFAKTSAAIASYCSFWCLDSKCVLLTLGSLSRDPRVLKFASSLIELQIHTSIGPADARDPNQSWRTEAKTTISGVSHPWTTK